MSRLLLFLCLFATSIASSAIPMPSNAEIRARLRTRLQSTTDTFQREVRRIGNGTIEMEVFAASEIDPAMAPRILSDYAHYDKWMLQDINQPLSGSAYVTNLHAIRLSNAAQGLLEAVYSFNVPLLKTERTVTFQLKSETTLEGVTIFAQSDEPTGALASARAVVKVFPSGINPRHSWIYVRGTVQLRSWILYEALPERVLARETGDRIRILLDNYLREESRQRQASSKTRRSS